MTPLPPEIMALLSEFEPRIRDAFLAAISQVQSQAQLSVITGYLEAGNIEMVVRTLQAGTAPFALLDKAIVDAYYAGGAMAIVTTGRLRDPFPGAE